MALKREGFLRGGEPRSRLAAKGWRYSGSGDMERAQLEAWDDMSGQATAWLGTSLMGLGLAYLFGGVTIPCSIIGLVGSSMRACGARDDVRKVRFLTLLSFCPFKNTFPAE